MVRLQHKLTDVVIAGSGCRSLGRHLGRRIAAAQQRLRRHRAEAARSATATADQIIARLRPKLAQVQGIALFLQAAQDLNVGGRLSRTQYQYTLQDSDLDELNDWAPRLLAKLQKLPQLRDVASDQQASSTMLSLSIDRDQAARFGIQPSAIDATLYDAFGQRQAAQYFTQLNSYHVILEIDPALQANPDTLNKLYITSPVTGQQVPLSTFVKFDTNHVNYLSINHQGQFPAVTLSFNLAPGTALGEAVDAIKRPESARFSCRRPFGHLPGHGAGVPDLAGERALSDPGRPGRRLHHPRHALRELYPPADHSLDPAFRRHGRPAHADAVPFRPLDHRLGRHPAADRDRQEERHHDGRFRHPGRTRTGPRSPERRYAKRACCASARS